MADNKITKSAGEFWVCAVLSRLGWASALTRDGIERTDILAAHPQGSHRAIQVKTCSPGSSRFHTGTKCCIPAVSENEWFVLVALGSVEWESPRAFVVPRNHVAAAVWIEHMEWQTNPSVEPGRRNTTINSARTSASIFARYEQRWDLMQLSTSEVPVMLPPRFRQLAREQRVGLRPDHPWNEELPEWEMTQTHESWSEWLKTDR